MSARVLLIAADSVEPDLIREWAADGTLPGFARLYAEGAFGPLTNGVPGLPGSAWPEVNTGLAGSKNGIYFPPHQFMEGESEARRVRPDEIDGESFHWNIAAAARLRVAAIDQIHTVPVHESAALQLTDWGAHDRLYQPASSPPELLAEVDARHGPYPIDSCDVFHGGTNAGYARLTDQLLIAAERKTNLLVDIIGRNDWDIFSASFGEAHCAGHQMWHLMEPSHPRHRRDAPHELHTAIQRVYQAVDHGIQRTIDAAGDDAAVIVVAAKGMGKEVGGGQLIPEVLHRLGLGAPLSLRRRLWSRVPAPLRSKLLGTIPNSVRQGSAVGRLPGFESGASAVSLTNDQDIGIRFGLIGRDHEGTIPPSVFEEVRGEVCEELRNLRLPVSGEPIVDAIIIADSHWDSGRVYTIPDVLVSFRKDIGLIEACESTRVGTVRGRLGSRTGNHNGHNALWVTGPEIGPSTNLGAVRTVDVPATLLALVNAAPPHKTDGRPIAALVNPAS